MRILLALSLFMGISFSSFSEHLTGGYITAKHIGNFRYILELHLFRDMDGVGGPTNALLRVNGDPNLTSIPLDYMGSSLNESDGFKIETLKYESDPVLLKVNKQYSFYWNTCCLNQDIINLQNHGSQDVTIVSSLFTGANGFSTAEISQNPVFTHALDTTLGYNIGAFTTTGDSIKYSFEKPFHSPSQGSLVQMNSYSFLENDFDERIQVHPNLGQVQFNPTTAGKFLLSNQIGIYHNGNRVSEVNLTYTILFTPMANPSGLKIKNFSSSQNSFPPFFTEFQIGDTIEYSFQIETKGNNVEIALGGAVAYLGPQTLQVDYSPNGVSSLKNVTLTWIPTSNVVEGNPNNLIVRVKNDLFAFDQIIFTRRVYGLGNEELPNDLNQINIYPNPSNGALYFETERHKVHQVQVYNLNGQLVDKINVLDQNGIYNINLQLDSAPYLLQFITDHGILTRKIMIQAF